MKKYVFGLVLFLILSFTTYNLNASNNIDPAVSLLKKYSKKYEKSSSDYVVVFDSTFVDVHSTGASVRTEYKLYKILTTDGATALHNIKYNYDPLTGKVKVLKARIIHKDFSIDTISSKEIYDYPQPAYMIYWGAREVMVNFGLLQVGDAIEIVIQRKGFSYALLAEDNDLAKFVPPMKGHFYDIVDFYNNHPIFKKVYTLMLDNNKEIQYQVYNGNLNSFKRFKDNKIIYNFSLENIKPFKREPNMVALSDVATKLIVTTTKSWKDKSLWFYKVNEDYGSFEYNNEIKKKVDEILKGAKDEEDSLWRLNHWVAHYVRYSGISMGKGEGYTLHKGTLTFKQRVGVCKDKAGMLITMLRAAGFESYPAMTMAGSRIENIPADQFNHCVTVVKSRRTGKYRLLDPTWVPYVREQWSSAEQQQQYLMGIPEGADLKTTPISPPEKHYFNIFNDAQLLNDGTLKGILTIQAEGQSDSRLRRTMNRKLLTGRKEFFYELFFNKYPQAKINDIKFQEPYDIDKNMQITIQYEIPNYTIISNKAIILKPLSTQITFDNRYLQYFMFVNTKMDKRKYPFRLGCSKQVNIKDKIKLPYGKKITNPLKLEKTDGSGANFDYNITMKKNSFELSSTLNLKKRIYDTNDYDSFKKAVNNFKKLTNYQFVVE